MAERSRTAQVYEALKQELLDGAYPPNRKLAIDQIAQQYGVSLGAIREALSRLTSDRLVVSIPQRGFLVAPVSAEDLNDLTSVRIEVETRCLRRSIICGDLEWEGRLLDTWHQLSRTSLVLNPDDMVTNPEWVRLHTRFHDDLIAACDSNWWLHLRDGLFIQAERYRRMLQPYAGDKRDVAKEHKQILDAALTRDVDIACDALAKHLRRTADILLASSAPFVGLRRSAPDDDGKVRKRAGRRRRSDQAL